MFENLLGILLEVACLLGFDREEEEEDKNEDPSKNKKEDSYY